MLYEYSTKKTLYKNYFMDLKRVSRKRPELREIYFENRYSPYAEGSCLVKFGNTHVICTASIEERVPMWLKGKQKGWITAEYGMIPRATHSRVDRDISKGKISGRTQEIQRHIGRSLRQAKNLDLIPGILITVDCDVLNADGGTRTASITGSFIATYMALKNYYNSSPKKFIKNQIAAISVGKVNNELLLDLDYSEDSNADFDMNLVLNEKLEIVEIQGTSEDELLSFDEMKKLSDLGSRGIQQILKEQNKILEEIDLH